MGNPADEVKEAVAERSDLEVISALEEPVLLRATEVARLLWLSRSKVYQMMSDGTLPVIRIGDREAEYAEASLLLTAHKTPAGHSAHRAVCRSLT
jgi:excisionase family DNA binding protein